MWKVFPESRSTLAALRERGLRTAVISNWDRRLPQILDALDLTRWFDVITVSAVEGVEKPAAAIFDRTVERLGVPAGACMHVGDSPLEDYDGAERAGMTPVLIDRRGAFAMDGFRRVGRLDEVLDLIG